MALIVRNEEEKPIHVSVFGRLASKLQQFQQELKEIGYHLKFPDIPLSRAVEGRYADMYIVDLPEVEQSISILQAHKLPFLVYGLEELPPQESVLELLYDALDYFTEVTPSVNSIRLKIQLGLHRYKERQNYNQRVQGIAEKIENNRLTGIATGMLVSRSGLSPEEVFEKLKMVSRNKQRRVADVAKEITQVLTSEINVSRSLVREGPIDNLDQWLDKKLLYRKQS